MREGRARWVPLAVMPAILPAALLPAMHGRHLPDYLLGGVAGLCIGLAIVAVVWTVRGPRCAASRRRRR